LLVNDAAKKIKKAGVSQIVSTNTIPGESAKVDVSRVIADALK
jgi:ribose-phosphate pyrophosphokinase